MGKCNKLLYIIFSYTTPKLVNIRSFTVGIISRIVQLIIISYIIGYVIVYQKGYQDVSLVESAVTTKVKGIIFTNFTDDEFNPAIKEKDRYLYRRVWDVADYVVPPSENGATFVATNIVITSNQTQSVCPEDINIRGAACDPNNNTCIAGKLIARGNGPMTGNCVEYSKDNYSCEIHAWCPVENDIQPLKNGQAVLGGSKNFTILIKNFVTFPKFKNSNRRNIKNTANETYLENCFYDSDNNPECPVFKLGDIIKWANEDYNNLAVKGAVIAIVLNWDCNFDSDKKYCFPSYSFRRLDDPTAKLAPGSNFRYANYYSDTSRTLYKVYGIKFSIIVQGQGGKFNIIPLLLNVGAGLGLFAIEVVVCDIIAFYILKQRKHYRSIKYEIVDNETDGKFLVVDLPETEIAITIESEKDDDAADGYQR